MYPRMENISVFHATTEPRNSHAELAIVNSQRLSTPYRSCASLGAQHFDTWHIRNSCDSLRIHAKGIATVWNPFCVERKHRRSASSQVQNEASKQLTSSRGPLPMMVLPTLISTDFCDPSTGWSVTSFIATLPRVPLHVLKLLAHSSSGHIGHESAQKQRFSVCCLLLPACLPMASGDGKRSRLSHTTDVSSRHRTKQTSERVSTRPIADSPPSAPSRI